MLDRLAHFAEMYLRHIPQMRRPTENRTNELANVVRLDDARARRRHIASRRNEEEL